MSIAERLRQWWSKPSKPCRAFPEAAVSLVLRDGEMVTAGPVFSAWTSGNLDAMLAALRTPAHPVDRHFLLTSIVAAAYRRRHETEMRALCITTARQHLVELPGLLEPLQRSLGGVLPRIPTFQHLSTVLGEQGEVDEAVAVCRHALSLGLRDGTKGGFEGRIARLSKMHPAKPLPERR